MSQNYKPQEMNLAQNMKQKSNQSRDENLRLNPSSSVSKDEQVPSKQNNRKIFSKIYPQAKFDEEEDEILKRVISGNRLFRDSTYDYRFTQLILPKMFKKEDEGETIIWTRLSKIYNISEFDLFDRGVREYSHYTHMFERLRREKVYFKPNELSLGWVETHFNYFNACNLLIKSYGIELVERLFDVENSFYKDVGAFKLTLNVGGIWTEYLVDDFVPLKTGGQAPDEFLYSGALRDSTEGIYEVWLLILEKALSKAFMGYEKLGDIPVFEYMRCLTGAPYELYRCGDSFGEFEGFETGEVDQGQAWRLIREALSKEHHVSFITIKGNERKLRRLERFNTSEKTIHLLEGVNYSIENIIEVQRKGRFIILDTSSEVKLQVPFEEFIREADYITVLKFNPSYTYNSSHIPLSDGHFLQSVAKFGIQDGVSYTIQLEQKCPYFFPRESRFRFNDIGITLAYLRENSLEYIGHKIAKNKSKLTFEIENTDGEEVKIIMLIDFECDEMNRELSSQWEGDLRHWRDLVVSVYGSEFSTINSLALDKNRGMVYDFFLHRIWREFSRSDAMKKEGEEIDVKAWEMDVGVEQGDAKKVQFMRQGCKLEHLTLYKFTNFSKSQIKLEGILDCELKEGLECFGPFEVNNINPSIVLNPSSNDILLFKNSDNMEKIEGVKFKNSGFKVKLTNVENPEDMVGQDPYEHVMKKYKVQSSRTYPSFTYEVGPMAGLDLNRFFERLKGKFNLDEPESAQASDEAQLTEEPDMDHKAPAEEVGVGPVRIRGTTRKPDPKVRIGVNPPQAQKGPIGIKRDPSNLSTEEIKIEMEGEGESMIKSYKVESLKVSGVQDNKQGVNNKNLNTPLDNYGNIGVSFGDYGENNQMFSASRARSKSKESKRSREGKIMFDSLESKDKNFSKTRSKEKSIFDFQQAKPKDKRETAAFKGVARENQRNQALSFGDGLGLQNIPQEVRTNPPTIPSISKSSSRKIGVSSKTSGNNLSNGVTSSSGHNTFIQLQSAPSSQSRLGSINEKPGERMKTPNTVFSEISKQGTGTQKIQIRNESRKEMEQKQMMISEIKNIGRDSIDRTQKPIEKQISAGGFKKSTKVAVARDAKSEIGNQKQDSSSRSRVESPNIPSTVNVKKTQGSSRQVNSRKSQHSPAPSPNRKGSVKVGSNHQSINSRKAVVSPNRSSHSQISKVNVQKVIRGSGYVSGRKKSVDSTKQTLESKDKKSQPIMKTPNHNELGSKSRTAGTLKKKSEASNKRVVIRADNSGVRQTSDSKEARRITPFRESSNGKSKAKKPRSKVSLANKTQRVTERTVSPPMPPKTQKNNKVESQKERGRTSQAIPKSQPQPRKSSEKVSIKGNSQPRETRPTANFNSVAAASNHGSVRSRKDSCSSPITVYYPRDKNHVNYPGKSSRVSNYSQKSYQSRAASVDSNREKTPNKIPSVVENKKRQASAGKPNLPPKSVKKTPTKRISQNKRTRTPKAPFSKPPIQNSTRAANANTPIKGSMTARARRKVQNPFSSNKKRNSSLKKPSVGRQSTKKNPKTNTKKEANNFNAMKRNMLKNTCRGLTPTIVSKMIPTPLRYSTNGPMGHHKIVRRSSRKKSKTKEKVVIKADGVSKHKISSSKKTNNPQIVSRQINLNNRFSKGIKLNESLNPTENPKKEKEKENKIRIPQQRFKQRKIMLENPFAVSYVKQGRVFVRGRNRQTYGVPRSTTPIGMMGRRNVRMPTPNKL